MEHSNHSNIQLTSFLKTLELSHRKVGQKLDKTWWRWWEWSFIDIITSSSGVASSVKCWRMCMAFVRTWRWRWSSQKWWTPGIWKLGGLSGNILILASWNPCLIIPPHLLEGSLGSILCEVVNKVYHPPLQVWGHYPYLNYPGLLEWSSGQTDLLQPLQ